MRSLFSGNRHSAPLGPPGATSGASSSAAAGSAGAAAAGETLQAVRQRQREKQRELVMRMMRAKKERDVAQDTGAKDKVLAAEADRRQMSDAADALAQQVMIIERIMEEFGLTLDLEEEARADREMLQDSREAYEQGVREADEAVQEQRERNEYVNSMSASYMMSDEAYDEDEAMRDLDELARQTGRV